MTTKTKTPPVIHCPIESCPLGQRALRFEQTGRYSGWTGYEGFGVITAYRYHGWAVTCWATVMAAAYDDGRVTPCFDHLDDASAALFCLMDLAELTGELKRLRRSMGVKPGQRVPYARFPALRRGAFRLPLQPIRPDFETNSRAIWSPANIRHVSRRHGETTAPGIEWRLAPAPVMSWHGDRA